jgi:hypothetical protein
MHVMQEKRICRSRASNQRARKCPRQSEYPKRIARTVYVPVLPVAFARIERGEGATGDIEIGQRAPANRECDKLRVEESQIGASSMLRRAAKYASNSVMIPERDTAVNDDKKAPPPTVRTCIGQTDYKRELAYQRLGINPKDVQCIPFFATQLRRIARTVRGADKHRSHTTPVRALDFLEYSEDPEARKVLEVYRSVPESYRRLLRPEDFCHAAGVSPWRTLEIIAGVVVRHEAQASAVIAALVRPRVVMKTVEMALRDEGIRDRVVFHKATGFM